MLCRNFNAEVHEVLNFLGGADYEYRFSMNECVAFVVLRRVYGDNSIVIRDKLMERCGLFITLSEVRATLDWLRTGRVAIVDLDRAEARHNV
ncbi:MAG: hypothetical protein MI757_14715 [Pirellulales bacterium]|nr:hypothetical protein [Pirellulales bacterium]